MEFGRTGNSNEKKIVMLLEEIIQLLSENGEQEWASGLERRLYEYLECIKYDKKEASFLIWQVASASGCGDDYYVFYKNGVPLIEENEKLYRLRNEFWEVTNKELYRLHNEARGAANEYINVNSQKNQYHHRIPGKIAAAFGSGYGTYVLNKPIVIYRAGIKGKPYGQIFSFYRPCESFCILEFDNNVSIINMAYALNIPIGTILYVGELSTKNETFRKGSKQIFIEKPKSIPGVKVLASYPLPFESLWDKVVRKIKEPITRLF